MYSLFNSDREVSKRHLQIYVLGQIVLETQNLVSTLISSRSLVCSLVTDTVYVWYDLQSQVPQSFSSIKAKVFRSPHWTSSISTTATTLGFNLNQGHRVESGH